jgi:hypothetical protein
MPLFHQLVNGNSKIFVTTIVKVIEEKNEKNGQ